MKIKIWTLTTDTNYGLHTTTFTTEKEADDAFRVIVETTWRDRFEEEIPDDIYEAWSRITDQVGFMDSMNVEAHEIDVPFPTYSPDIEAALCSWEWILEHAGEDGKLGPQFDNYGSGGMRMAAVQAGQIVLSVYDLMEKRGFEYTSAYDWEFVPAVLERLDWDQLTNNNQYGDQTWRPDPAPILDDMMATMEYFQDRWLEDAKREADKQWGYRELVSDCEDLIDRRQKPAAWVKAMGEDLDLTPKSTWMRGF